MKRLLYISYRFPPETYPLAIGLKRIVGYLAESCEIDVVTAAHDPWTPPNVTAHHVAPCVPDTLIRGLHSARLGKIVDWLTWPDRFLLWVIPALRTAYRLATERQPDAVVVFMMPYSTGLVGVLLKRLTGIPLVFNLDDSPTCSDLHATHPSPLHYRMNAMLEDLYVRASDAIIYVSKRTLDRVRERQPAAHRDKFHLVRFGSDLPSVSPAASSPESFHLVYTGAMSGWHDVLDAGASSHAHTAPSLPRRAYRAWQEWGVYHDAVLDPSTHSPVFVGQALRVVLERRPEWQDRLWLDVYGPRYPTDVEAAVLDRFGLQEVVRLHPPVSHDAVLRHTASADLLFMTLPERLDGTPGGRISAKTYEYLSTDRPILAALPPGENRDFLTGRPGVVTTDPRDVDAMADAIERLARRKFRGDGLATDRSALRASLSGTRRARAIQGILRSVVDDVPLPPGAPEVVPASR